MNNRLMRDGSSITDFENGIVFMSNWVFFGVLIGGKVTQWPGNFLYGAEGKRP
jgi:hypothetical protein